MNQLVAYKSNALVITIFTASPSALHNFILIGINEAMKHYINNPDKSDSADGLLALLTLQKSLIPNETELEKAH